MTDTRKVMQQALEALEKVTSVMLQIRDELAERGGRPKTNVSHQKLWDAASDAYGNHAIQAAEALRSALAQQGEQQPVAWISKEKTLLSWDKFYDDMEPLYAGAAPAAQPVSCHVCGGKRGGVPGNGNLINGVVVCDYCHADGKAEALATNKAAPAAQPQDDRPDGALRIQMKRDGQWQDVQPYNDLILEVYQRGIRDACEQFAIHDGNTYADMVLEHFGLKEKGQ